MTLQQTFESLVAKHRAARNTISRTALRFEIAQFAIDNADRITVRSDR